MRAPRRRRTINPAVWGVVSVVAGGTVAEAQASQANGTRSLAVLQEDSGEIRFVDTDGDEHRLAAPDGRWRWCSTAPGLGCRPLREVRLDFGGGCNFEVMLLPFSVAPVWRAVVARPSAGPDQLALAETMGELARRQRVRIGGPVLSGLNASSASAHPSASSSEPALALEPPLVFPAPIVEASERGPLAELLRLRIQGDWRGLDMSGNCAAIVERPEDCSACAFSRASCGARPSNTSRLDEFLVLDVPRPPFSRRAIAASALSVNHSVCFRGVGPVGLGVTATIVMLGRLTYYQLPKVTFMPNVVSVGVRTFLNPGWRQEITLECTNCSKQNRIVVQPVLPDDACKGLTQQSLAAIAAAARDGQVPLTVGLEHHENSKIEEIIRTQGSEQSMIGVFCAAPPRGPCNGQEAFGVDPLSIVGTFASTSSAGNEAVFMLESERRLLARERQVLFHKRSALCFYPSEGLSDGWLVGFVAVHMDGPDMQAFIGFVCFFGVALPLICLVTALLHYNKYERCKQHLQQLRLDYQREQLDSEMSARRGGHSRTPSLPVVQPQPLHRPRVTVAQASASSSWAASHRTGLLSGAHSLGLTL